MQPKWCKRIEKLDLLIWKLEVSEKKSEKFVDKHVMDIDLFKEAMKWAVSNYILALDDIWSDFSAHWCI